MPFKIYKLAEKRKCLKFQNRLKKNGRNFILGIYFMTSLSHRALNKRTRNGSVRMILNVAIAV
jgi:hypothetical protein